MSFFVGDLVEVAKEHRTGQKDSEGGRAYIQAINNDDEGRGTKRAEGRGTKRPRYDVKYLIGTATSPNVKQQRIKPVAIETIARRRLGDIGNRPSLLSRHQTDADDDDRQSSKHNATIPSKHNAIAYLTPNKTNENRRQ
jgi:hypothetical protein